MKVRLENSDCPKKQNSIYNYRVHLERTPTGEQLDQCEHQQSAFTFEHSASKDKFRNISFFDCYKENESQTIAKKLIEENVLLKQQIRKCHHLMKELQLQLNSCRQKIKQFFKGRQTTKEGIVQELKSELFIVLEKNKLVKEELNQFRLFLPSVNRLLKRNETEERYRPSSLDFKQTKKSRQEYTPKNIQANKTEEFMNSIKNMHSKIMGFQVENLKELWRWLKSMGYSYSYLRKCRHKLQESQSSSALSRDKLFGFLKELTNTLDD